MRFYDSFVSPRTAGVKAGATVGVVVAVLSGGGILWWQLGFDWRAFASMSGFVIGLLIGIIVVAVVPEKAKALTTGIGVGMLFETVTRTPTGSLPGMDVAESSLGHLSVWIARLTTFGEDAMRAAGIRANSNAIACGLWCILASAVLVVIASSLFLHAANAREARGR